MLNSINPACDYNLISTIKFDTPQAAITLSSDGSMLVTAEGCTSATAASTDSKIKVWSVESGMLMNSWSYPPITYDREADRIYSLSLTSDNQVLVTGGHKTKIWNIKIGDEIRTLRNSGWAFYTNISTNDEILATSTGDRTVIWNLPKNKKISQIVSYSYVNYPSLSPNGLLLANLVSHNRAKAVRVWNTISGDEVWSLELDRGIEVRQISFSPDNLLLAGGGDDSIYVWDVTKGQRTGTISKFKNISFHKHLDLITDTAFAYNNQVLFSTGSDGKIQFWDIETGINIGTLETKYSIGAMLVSGNSKTIVGIVGGKLNSQIAEVWRRN